MDGHVWNLTLHDKYKTSIHYWIRNICIHAHNAIDMKTLNIIYGTMHDRDLR